MTPEEYWKIVGEYFGYPPCCIEWFCEKEYDHDGFPIVTDAQLRESSKGIGFIPCPSCAEAINLDLVTAEDLISDTRENPSPFPFEDFHSFMIFRDNLPE